MTKKETGVQPWADPRRPVLRRIAAVAMRAAACAMLAACLPEVAQVAVDCEPGLCIAASEAAESLPETGGYLYATVFDSTANASAVVGYVIDPGSGALTAVPGPYPLTANQTLVSIGADPAGKFVFTVETGSPGVLYGFVIGGDGSLTPGATASVAVGPSPSQAVMDQTGSTVYVINSGGGSTSEYAVDAVGTLTSLGNTAPGGGLGSVAVHPSNDFAIITRSADLHVMERTSGGSLANSGPTISTSGAPRAVAIDPLGDYAVATTGVPSIDLVRITTGPPGLTLVDTQTPSSPSCSGAFYAVFDPAGRFVFVNCGTDSRGLVYALDRTNDLLVPTPVGEFAAGQGSMNSLAISRGGRFIYHVYPTATSIDIYATDPDFGDPVPLPAAGLPPGFSGFFSGGLARY